VSDAAIAKLPVGRASDLAQARGHESRFQGAPAILVPSAVDENGSDPLCTS
jgi:hypothetical protein